MSKIEEAKQILEALGLPVKQQNDRSALTLLALSKLTEEDNWVKAKAISMSVMGNKENAKYKIRRHNAFYYGTLQQAICREFKGDIPKTDASPICSGRYCYS